MSYLRRHPLWQEFIIALLLISLQGSAFSQVTAPGWWAQRNVTNPLKPADDFSALNQGQLKNLVRQAVAEMNSKLEGGAGPALNTLVTTWLANTQSADNYAVVNQGQLKAAALPIYQRLLTAGVITSLPAWTNPQNPSSDPYALANIGQAKNLFAFEMAEQPSVVTSGWENSLWTSLPIAVPDSYTAPAAIPFGTVKDIHISDTKAAPQAASPYLEARSAEYEGFTTSTGGGSYLLRNGRANGLEYPYSDVEPSTFPVPIFHDVEPPINDTNLSNDWVYFQPSSYVAGCFTNYDYFSNLFVTAIYFRKANWRKVRMTLPPGATAQNKIIQEYYRQDQTETGSTSIDKSKKYVFTINAGANRSNEITFEPTAAWQLSKLVLIKHKRRSQLSPSDAGGPKYRKIALNGVPQPDSPPQNQEEHDIPADETYVDAYTRSLRHAVTDVWSKAGASEIPLTVRRISSSEIWSKNSGLRPDERPDRPFGAGFTSNLTPNITFMNPAADSNEPPRATVVDENGSGRSFIYITIGSEKKWVPTLDERQDAKICYDELTQVPGGWVLRKKYGTECHYEMMHLNDPRGWTVSLFGGASIQHYAADRKNGSQANIYPVYARMTKVIDRLGNELRYEYPTSISGGVSIEGMIPWKIYDPKRPWQMMTLKQSDGRVVQVCGPSGEMLSYNYVVEPDSGQTVLQSVKRGAAPEVITVEYNHIYSEQNELDPDPTIPNPAEHAILELASITDERGNTHSFEYETSSQTSYEYESGYSLEQKWMKRMSGTPRLLKSILRPNNQEVVFTGERTLKYYMDGRVETNGITTTVSSPTTGMYTYTFTQPHVFCPLPLTEESSQNVILSFTKMDIQSAAGTEHYKFDPEAGMALKRAEDISGNVTSYTYEDAIPSPSAVLTNYRLLKYDDPTTETSPMHGQTDHEGNVVFGVKRYDYHPSLRLLTGLTDERGTRTQYEINSVTGLRTKETVTDAAGNTLRVTDFNYDDILDPADSGDVKFTGFLTSQVVKTTGLGAPTLGMSAPIGEMRTEFVHDLNGRIKKQIIYAGGTDNPATPDINEALPLVTSYTYTGNGSKKTVTDPRNLTTTFEYGAHTLRLEKVIYPDASSKELFYDPHGNLVKETNEQGVPTFHQYDELNRRIKSTVDLNGNTTTDGRYTSLTPGGETAAPFYNGDLVTETEYNDFNLPIYEINARGVKTQHLYDTVGRRTQTIVNADDPDSDQRLVTRYVDEDPATSDWVGGSMFDTAGFRPRRTIDARNFVTEFEYDKKYRPIRTTLNDTAYQHLIVTETAYDAMGNAVMTKDALGNVTRTEYDGLGRAVRVYLPSSAGGLITNVPPATRTMKYTPAGQPWSSTDEMGNTTLTFYDNAGRPVKTVLPAVLAEGVGALPVNPVTLQSYDQAGNVRLQADALGNLTQTRYDSRNRADEVTMPEVEDAEWHEMKRPKILTDYDLVGRVTKVTDPLGRATHTRFDKAGRVYAVIAPPVGSKKHITVNTHDASGNILTTTNAKEQTITNTYDRLGRLITTTDHASITNRFGYDKAGNRTSVKDGLDQETIFHYDAQNRLRQQTFANLDTWVFRYDALNKTGQTDAKAVTTEYLYDVRNRLRRTTAPDLDRLFSYDHAGRLLSVKETGHPEADVVTAYDALGRIISEKSQGVQHLYSYDLVGNRRIAAYGTGRTVSTTYDALNRPHTLTEDNRTTTYGYDLAGRALVLVAGNSLATMNYYDALGRLVNRTLFQYQPFPGDEPDILAQFVWYYDAIGNVIKQTEDWRAGASRPEGLRLTTNTYDDASRLLTETITHTADEVTTTETATTYGYDPANNRKTKTVTGAGIAEYWEYDYNAANQLENWTVKDSPNGTLKKSAGLAYDGNGNRTSRQIVDQMASGTPALTSQGITYQALPQHADDNLSISLKADVSNQPLSATVGTNGHVEVSLATGSASPDSLVDQGITYATKLVHQSAQPVTVSLQADLPDQVLGVTTSGNHVDVALATTCGAKAGASSQNIHYEAKNAGAAGNDLRVRLQRAATGEQPDASVQDDTVVVKVPAAGDSPDILENQGISYTTTADRSAGQEVSLAIVAEGPGQAASVDVVGNDIQVKLATSMGKHAAATAQGLTFRAVEPGAAGNVTLEIGLAAANAPLSVTVEGRTVKVWLANDGGQIPVVSSTQAQVAALLAADEDVQEFLIVSGADGPPMGEEQGIVYAAVAPAITDNEIKIQAVAAAHQEATSATLDGKTVKIRLANQPGTKATLALPGFTYETVEPTALANDMHVVQSVSTTPGRITTASLLDNELRVNIGRTAGTRATMNFAGVTFTATQPGAAANGQAFTLDTNSSNTTYVSDNILHISTEYPITRSELVDMLVSQLSIVRSYTISGTVNDGESYVSGGGGSFSGGTDPTPHSAAEVTAVLSTAFTGMPTSVKVQAADTAVAAGNGTMSGGTETTYLTTTADLVNKLNNIPAVRNLISVSGGSDEKVRPFSIELAGSNGSSPMRPQTIELKGDGDAATAYDQGITYEAIEPGLAGNGIQIDFLVAEGELPEDPVIVDGKNIAVTLPVGHTVKARTGTESPFITYEAQTSGPAANGHMIDHRLPDDPDSPLVVEDQGERTVVYLATDSGDAAEASWNALHFTAKAPGRAGNDIQIHFLTEAEAAQPVMVNVERPSNYPPIITITVRTTYFGSIIAASYQQMVTRIMQEAGDLVTVTTATPNLFPTAEQMGNLALLTGGGDHFNSVTTIQDILQYLGDGTGIHQLKVIPQSSPPTSTLIQPLTGAVLKGGELYLDATADDIVDLLNSTPAAKALIKASGGGTGLMLPSSVWLKDGGRAYEVVTTVADVVELINQHPAAQELITATGTGTSVVQPMQRRVLHGGTGSTLSMSAAAIVTLINADEDVNDLITATLSSSPGTVPLREETIQLTGGGEGYTVTSTAEDVAGLLAENSLITATWTGSGPLHPIPRTPLRGGEPLVLSTAAHVVALLTDTPGAASLMTVTGSGSLPLLPMERTYLHGKTGTAHYRWDSQNRLTGVTMPDSTRHDYTYDYRTRRIGTARLAGPQPAQNTAIVFSGGLSLAEYESAPGTGSFTPASPTVHYLRGPDMGGGVGGMLYSIRDTAVKYSLSNGRGDIVAQSDQTAAITWSASYEAYGKRPLETGTNLDKQRANSKDEDPTGLLNEGFRYRDIETGMWLSRDPAGFVDGPNLYAYVKQNPWTSFDPDGLQAWGPSTMMWLRPTIRVGVEGAKVVGESGARTAPEMVTPKPTPPAGTNFRPSIDPTIVPNPKSNSKPAEPTTSQRKTQDDNHKILYIQNNYDEGSSQSNELHEFVGQWNGEIAKRGGSMTTQSVDVFTRTAADRAAAQERKRDPAAYEGKVVGHVPDVGAGGDTNGPFMPLDSRLNGSIGSQVGWHHRRSKSSTGSGFKYNEVKVLPKPPPPPKPSVPFDPMKFASN